MPLQMGRVLSMEDEPSSSSATEYRQQFLSPRREDYIPQVALPKINSGRPPSNQYRLHFENYHPKRPYCFHAQPSHVFDYVPKPLDRKPSSRSICTSSTGNISEYNERYPNYRSFIPTQELLPPHLSDKSDTQSDTQRKKEHMIRSQYFHQLVQDNEKYNGGQRVVGTSEQRTAFQWPYNYPPPPPKPVQQAEVPPTVYPPYTVPRNIYEPLPPIQRTIIHVLPS